MKTTQNFNNFERLDTQTKSQISFGKIPSEANQFQSLKINLKSRLSLRDKTSMETNSNFSKDTRMNKTDFKLRFIQDKLLDLQIRDSKLKYQDQKIQEYEDPPVPTFRQENIDNYKKPFIIKFKPGEFKYFSDYQKRNNNSLQNFKKIPLKSQKISKQIQEVLNIQQLISSRFYKKDRVHQQ